MHFNRFRLQYFQKDLPELVERDTENLFNLAFSMKINPKQMKKWEKEHIAVRKKEQEEMGELRVSEMPKHFPHFVAQHIEACHTKIFTHSHVIH